MCMMEVFINDVPMFHTTSDVALGEGLEMMPWINVEPFAGQTATLTVRISNPNADTSGKIKIDDLIVAKIEDSRSAFPWLMFLPAMFGNGK